MYTTTGSEASTPIAPCQMRKQVEFDRGHTARSGENSHLGSVGQSTDSGNHLGHDQFLKGVCVPGHMFTMKADRC